MLKTVTISAAAMGMLFSALLGLVVMPLLLRMQRAHRSFVAQQEQLHPTEDIAPRTVKDIPALGGGVLWIGCCAAVVFAWSLAAPSLAENGYAEGWTRSALLIGGSLPLGLVGMAEDCLRIFRQNGKEIRPLTRLALQSVCAAAMLVVLYFSGNTSTLVHLANRWVDLGIWYWPASMAAIVCISRSAASCAETDGVTAGGGFVAAFAFLIIGMLMLETDPPGGRFVIALYAAALAGGCIGFLFWNYYPARIAIGSAGAQFLAAALVMIAWNLGRPELLLICVLPWIINGLIGLVTGLWYNRRRMTPDQLLKAKGWGAPAITAVFCGAGCVGALLSVLQVWFAV